MVESLDAATDDGARALRRLQTELIGWLDGQPRRPAAGLADLVPVGWRGAPDLFEDTGTAQRQHRGPAAGRVQSRGRNRRRGRRHRRRRGAHRARRAGGVGKSHVHRQVPGHARRLRVDARMVLRALLRPDPHPTEALAAVKERLDAQSSAAISSAARRAPSGSTGRYAIGRSSSSAIAAAMASGSDVQVHAPAGTVPLQAMPDVAVLLEVIAKEVEERPPGGGRAPWS